MDPPSNPRSFELSLARPEGNALRVPDTEALPVLRLFVADDKRTRRGQDGFMEELRVATGWAGIGRRDCIDLVSRERAGVDRTDRRIGAHPPPRRPSGVNLGALRRFSSMRRRTRRSNDSTPTGLPSESTSWRRREASRRQVSGRRRTTPLGGGKGPRPGAAAPERGDAFPTPRAPIRIVRNGYERIISSCAYSRYHRDAPPAPEAEEEDSPEGLRRGSN